MQTQLAAPPTSRVPVTLLALPGTCWRCGRRVLPIVGVFVPSPDGRRFIEFLDVAPRLAATISTDQLNALGVGAIKIRRSRARPDGYLANGCVYCDAILGDFPLREDLATFRAEPLREGGASRQDFRSSRKAATTRSFSSRRS
jgi:hypothetical protein